MAQLIEIDSSMDLPAEVYIRKDDMLLVRVSGGHVLSGEGIIEMLGPYLTALLKDDGTSLAPMGAPNTLFFLAKKPGRANVDVVTGDPWHSPRIAKIEIIVDP